jgi:hypothetical protein
MDDVAGASECTSCEEGSYSVSAGLVTIQSVIPMSYAAYNGGDLY